MTNFLNSWVVVPGRDRGSRDRNTAAKNRRTRSQRRRSLPACEALEGRVVLTFAGSSSLLGSLSDVGVVTSPVASISVSILPMLSVLPTPIVPLADQGASSAWSQLGSDLQTLRTELKSLAGKSGVTIADLQSLTSDSQSIAQAGFYFDVKGLNSVISELATAVAGGSSTSQARTDFTALFSGSSVSATTVNTTFTDLVRTIQDSAITTTDLSTVAAAEAAIQADLSKLPIPWLPDGLPWLDQVGTTPDTVSLTLIAVSPAAAVSSPIFLPPPIIISPFGDASLLGGLSSMGVVTSPVIIAPPVMAPPPMMALPTVTALHPVSATAYGPYSKLQADLLKLQTELQALAAKSGLTIADLQNLVSDGQAINQAGFFFNVHSLDTVISELATSVAGASSTSHAQTDFTALFSNSSVSTTTINTTFSDLVKAIRDSKVLPIDLTTVAADQAAIQADLKMLYPVNIGGSGSGTGTPGSDTGGTTGSRSNGGTRGHKHPGGGHKVHHGRHVFIKTVNHSHARALSRTKKH